MTLENIVFSHRPAKPRGFPSNSDSEWTMAQAQWLSINSEHGKGAGAREPRQDTVTGAKEENHGAVGLTPCMSVCKCIKFGEKGETENFCIRSK